MKFLKVITVLLILLFSLSNKTLADELRLDKDTKYQQMVMETGFKLLNSSNTPYRTTFFYNTDNKIKVKVSNRDKSVTIYKGTFALIEDNDELAAAISPAIATLIDMHSGFFRRFSISFSPRKYKEKADKKAVDLMVNAGYDPVALITFLNKTSAQPNWFEYNIFEHSGSERTAYIYRYIYEKYPVYLDENNYLKTKSYQNFLHTSKDTRHETMLIQKERIKNKNKE